MDAEKEDQRLFYKIVNKQRKTPQQATNALVMEGFELTTPDEILGGWKLHFQKLATPDNNITSLDSNLKEQTILNDILIQQVCSDINEPVIPVSHEEVKCAFNHLKKNKAPDAYGITSEHIQLAQETLIPLLTSLVNNTIETGSLPQHLKEGVLTPVLKKRKRSQDTIKLQRDHGHNCLQRNTGTYITIKTEQPAGCVAEPTTKRLHCKNITSEAAFLVSEAISEHTDQKSPMALVTLDAEKAFDRV